MKTNPNFRHKLVLFCGPSGSGKTTIVHHLLNVFPLMRFSISATTRSKRPNEIDGKDYHFLTSDEFRARIANNEFLEWELLSLGCRFRSTETQKRSSSSRSSLRLCGMRVESGQVKRLVEEIG